MAGSPASPAEASSRTCANGGPLGDRRVHRASATLLAVKPTTVSPGTANTGTSRRWFMSCETLAAAGLC